MTDEAAKPIRQTQTVREQLLKGNEGFSKQTYFKGKNFEETRDTRIEDEKVIVRSRGKTSWADSRYDQTRIADEAETARFLRESKDELDWAGVDPGLKTQKPTPAPISDEGYPYVEDSEGEQEKETSDQVIILLVVAGAGIAYGVWKFRKPIERKFKEAAAAVRTRFRKSHSTTQVGQRVDDVEEE